MLDDARPHGGRHGRPFGLELYRGGRAASSQKPLPAPLQIPAAVPVPADVCLGFHPDDATPKVVCGHRWSVMSSFIRPGPHGGVLIFGLDLSILVATVI